MCDLLNDHMLRQAALAKKFKEVARATRYIPGTTASSAAGPSFSATQQFAEAKASPAKALTPSAETKATKRPSTTPNSLLKTASASNLSTTQSAGAASRSRRPSTATVQKGSPASSATGVSAARYGLRMSLTRGVYAAAASAQQKSVEQVPSVDGLTLSESGPVRMLGLDGQHVNGSAEGAVPFDPQPKEKELTSDDLLDLFSPLHLSSIRTNRGKRKRDVVKGSTVRDYFAIFEQRDVPLAQPEDPHQKRVARAGITASGVGMPKTEKVFLEAYEYAKKGSPVKAIQTNDGHISAASPTAAAAGGGTAPSLASYQTPTLSYSWRLATRRRSVGSAGPAGPAAAGGPSLNTRSGSPLPNQRDLSPSPRRASAASPVPPAGSRTLSPKRSAHALTADPVDSLGIDQAIEKLTKNMNRGAGASVQK
jgi:hypothetical protein